MKLNIRDLDCSNVDTKPRNIDWSINSLGDEDGDWEAWEAAQCEGCHKLLVLRPGDGNDEHCNIDSDTECRGHVSQFEGPMMNYFYPVARTLDPEEATRTIAHLPLCVARLDDEYGLALTGGGMDLSWEIIEAYVLLGYLPPTHFLPEGMCGRGTSARDLTLLKAYRRSCVVQIRWVRDRMKRSRDLTQWELERVAAQAKKKAAR